MGSTLHLFRMALPAILLAIVIFFIVVTMKAIKVASGRSGVRRAIPRAAAGRWLIVESARRSAQSVAVIDPGTVRAKPVSVNHA